MNMYCEFEKVNSEPAQMSELQPSGTLCSHWSRTYGLLYLHVKTYLYQWLSRASLLTTYYLQFSFMKTRDPIFCGFHGKINPHGMFNSRTLKKLVNQ